MSELLKNLARRVLRSEFSSMLGEVRYARQYAYSMEAQALAAEKELRKLSFEHSLLQRQHHILTDFLTNGPKNVT